MSDLEPIWAPLILAAPLAVWLVFLGRRKRAEAARRSRLGRAAVRLEREWREWMGDVVGADVGDARIQACIDAQASLAILDDFRADLLAVEPGDADARDAAYGRVVDRVNALVDVALPGAAQLTFVTALAVSVGLAMRPPNLPLDATISIDVDGPDGPVDVDAAVPPGVLAALRAVVLAMNFQSVAPPLLAIRDREARNECVTTLLTLFESISRGEVRE